MRRLDPDVVAGTLLTVLCLAVAVPVLVLQLGGYDPTVGPGWLWWACFAGYVFSLTVCTWLVEVLPRPRLLVALAVQALLGPTVVLLAPQAGWTPILLVFTAATSAYLVSRPVSVALVAANTLVVATGAARAQGPGPGVVIAGALYLLLQALSLMAVISQQADVASRQALAEAHVELRATSVLLAGSSREAERLRIARDLHDVVGHQLTALALELEIATHRPGPEHVIRARGIAKDLLVDVRGAVSRLREEGSSLSEALAEVVRDLPHPVVHLAVAPAADQVVDGPTRTALVRCLQEVVTNVIRHSGAENLWVTVDQREGRLHLVARDDGRGAAGMELGNGLTGMRERFEQLGGQVIFIPQKGFEVRVEVSAA
ncbi:hypothetical protein BA895_16800 [Humibacillus sp. DSM 29435]|uniref:sensor histidine kinase n=1 Tax=Humibacillus sp. DSM 29435 TaxID=1869167 RepID=UPI0008730226|nr:histidine kinase [Humibacillus sp. DSM 29435]OFE17133.1 hypothetical protein BA895_16800 [Humibacillus sp. DSM 29435]